MYLLKFINGDKVSQWGGDGNDFKLSLAKKRVFIEPHEDGGQPCPTSCIPFQGLMVGPNTSNSIALNTVVTNKLPLLSDQLLTDVF